MKDTTHIAENIVWYHLQADLITYVFFRSDILNFARLERFENMLTGNKYS